jgi:hypothetical protein
MTTMAELIAFQDECLSRHLRLEWTCVARTYMADQNKEGIITHTYW